MSTFKTSALSRLREVQTEVNRNLAFFGGLSLHEAKLKALSIWDADQTLRGQTVLRCEFGNYVVSFDCRAQATKVEKISSFLSEKLSAGPQAWADFFIGVNPAFTKLIWGELDYVPGCAPATKFWSNGRLAGAGLSLVLGGADLAKTPAVHLLASDGSEEYGILRYGEPISGSLLDEMDAAVEFGACLLRNHSVSFDSVKDMLSESPGGSMNSGISRGALPLFSSISTLSCELGVAVYAPLNPSASDVKIMDMMNQAIKSNVCSLIIPDGSSLVFSCRTGEGLKRDTFSASAGFEKGSLIMTFSPESKGNAQRPSKTEVKAVTTSPLTDAHFSTLLRKYVASLHN